MSETAKTPASQRIPKPNAGQRLLWSAQCSVILAVIWLALTGFDALLLGAIAAVIGGVFGAWMVPGLPHAWRPLRLFRFSRYFIWTSIAGGIDVAWQALQPRMDIRPAWLRYRLSLPPGQPRTLMVSILSLMPGTLSAELQADNMLLVHVLDGGNEDQARSSVADLERELAWFFSLPAPEGEGR
ncbi:MAG: Na+/H+ antiporter subunit E [Gammaproteobacteria bacterium]|nr:Na+/H+ antiporter subunit E [Gammaproteobacteria bacterium]